MSCLHGISYGLHLATGTLNKNYTPASAARAGVKSEQQACDVSRLPSEATEWSSEATEWSSEATEWSSGVTEWSSEPTESSSEELESRSDQSVSA